MQESSFNAAKELATSRQVSWYLYFSGNLLPSSDLLQAEYLALERIKCLLDAAWLHMGLYSICRTTTLTLLF